MDPITLAIGAAGLATSLFFGNKAQGNSNQIAQYKQFEAAEQQQKFGLEQKVSDQRQNAMELSARRQSMEDFRKTQQARAQGLLNSTTQNAQFGSGAAGGQASIQSEGAFQQQGIGQNLTIGRNIFGLDKQISGVNNNIAQLKGRESLEQSQMANNQQWASLGGQIMSSAGTIGKVGQYVGGAVTGTMTNLNFLSQGPTGFLSNR